MADDTPPPGASRYLAGQFSQAHGLTVAGGASGGLLAAAACLGRRSPLGAPGRGRWAEQAEDPALPPSPAGERVARSTGQSRSASAGPAQLRKEIDRHAKT